MHPPLDLGALAKASPIVNCASHAAPFLHEKPGRFLPDLTLGTNESAVNDF